MDASAIADVLEAAADYIDVNGWCQNNLGTTDGRVCLLGALNRAQGRPTYAHAPIWDSPLTCAAASAVGDRLGVVFTGVATWNDVPGRTKYEVIDALKGTAKDLRNGEVA